MTLLSIQIYPGFLPHLYAAYIDGIADKCERLAFHIVLYEQFGGHERHFKRQKFGNMILIVAVYNMRIIFGKVSEWDGQIVQVLP